MKGVESGGGETECSGVWICVRRAPLTEEGLIRFRIREGNL